MSNVQQREIAAPLKHLHLHLFLLLFLLKPCSEGEMGWSPVPVRGWTTTFGSSHKGPHALTGRYPIIISTLARHWYRKKPHQCVYVDKMTSPAPQQIDWQGEQQMPCLHHRELPPTTQDVRTTCSRYMEFAISLCTKELCNVLTFTDRCWKQCLCNSERKKVKYAREEGNNQPKPSR